MDFIESVKASLGAVVRLIVKNPKSLNDSIKHEVARKALIEHLKLLEKPKDGQQPNS